MILFLSRYWRRARRVTWLFAASVVLFVFLTSWLFMWLAEPDGDITKPSTFWWYFLVTSATVGYGDVFPKTDAGRLVGAYIIVGGITTLTIIFARVSTLLENARSRRMQGLANQRHSGHIVVVGYTSGRTEKIVMDLLADGTQHVVICAWDDQSAQHPMPTEERVHFVRGALTDEDVLDRASIESAHSVLIDARDDNEAVSVTIAAERAASGVHTVVALRDLERRRTIRKIDSTAHCVQWHSVAMIVEELHDPGIALVYQELMNAGGPSTYSSVVPSDAAGLTYGDWQASLGRVHQATVLAVSTDHEMAVSPAWDTTVPAGATLYYVAGTRLTPEALSMAARSRV